MIKYDRIFQFIIIILILAVPGTITLCIWVIKAWWLRIILLISMPFIIYYGYLAAAFWLAAKANLKEIKESEDD